MSSVKQVLVNRVKLHWAIFSVGWVLASPIFASEVIVSPGDTLWSLAKSHGITVSLLKTFNRLESDEIIVGMVLELPIPEGLTTENDFGEETNEGAFDQSTPVSVITKDIVLSLYRVNRGDNLLGIAISHGTEVEILKTLNGLRSDIVQAGVILILPKNIQTVAQTVNDSPHQESFSPESGLGPVHASPVTSETNVLDLETTLSETGLINSNQPNSPSTLTYFVRHGDTLSDIANFHGTTVEHLVTVNKLQSDLIKPGTMLNLDHPLTKHRVQPGENLSDIAKAYGTDLDLLLKINRLDVDIVNPDTVLIIPSPIRKSHTHIVIKGDTLYDIAMVHSISIEDLIDFNNLDGNVIHPDQVLILSSTQPRTKDYLEVTVNAGDTVWEIAQTYNSTVSAIAITNDLTDTARIRPGDILKIPGTSTSMLTSKATSNQQTLIAQRGDTLSEIAQRFNTTVAALISTNNLTSDQIVIGQIIKIFPGKDFLSPRTTGNAVDSPGNTSLVWPLIGPITSRFGYRQLRLTGTNWHSGLDIDGVTGDPIRAAAAGVVSYSGWKGGYGNLVIVKAGDTEYYYAHASTLHVSEGEFIQTGQLLARVGATGRTTGSHLHFEVRISGTPVDPLNLLKVTAAR